MSFITSLSNYRIKALSNCPIIKLVNYPIIKLAHYLIILTLLSNAASAQTTYPLQVNVNLLPPYSLYLSDYYSTTREKLVVTLINRDQLKPSVNVRLRMIITTPGGVRIQTNDNAFFQPVMVENGSPVRLTQDELAPYFQPSNFITQGYLTGGKLPEGMVEFCFQAIEAYTGQVLSASTCTRAWITSQKPPLLSLPRNNESIAFREPLNVLFQWTPVHQGLALVEYDFILKELWDNGMTPQAAFPYSPEIYRETTRSTSIIYGALQPALLPGKRYAWCVRAKAREGMDEVNLFQNDGYSEIRWFTLQDNCLPPEFVEASAERKRINLSWSTLPEHIGFTVSYRIKSVNGETQNEWKEQQTQEAQAILYGLQSGATYEYRIASMCMAGQPVYTPIMQIVIPETDSARLAQCGILPDVNLTNQEPLKELKTGEEFKAGDFPITVVSISGSNGNFSGQGWTIIPWLNDAKVAVEFKNIIINTNHQMTNGYVEAKYDKTEGQIANLDDVFEGGYDVGKVKTGLTRTDTTFTFSIPGVESFALSDEGDFIITDSEGTQHSIGTTREGEGNEGNKVIVFPMTVQDKDGNVYQVEKITETDSSGTAVEKIKATKLATIGAPLAADSFDPTQLNGDKAIVTFTKGKGVYAFDTWEPYYEKILLIRDKYQQLYTGYYAPWKFLPAGQTDKVTATIKIEDNTIDPAKVIFKTPKGTEYKAERDGNIYTLQITSGPEGDVQELYALHPRDNGKYYTLGKLGIATYAQQHYEVVLVSVNGSPVDVNAINQTLKEIYEPVGVSWSVVKDDFSYTGNYRVMDNNTGLSTYNEAMRELNNAYKAARPTYNKKTNYLFFLKATGSEDINNRDFTGFMPRGAQFGYIFTSEIQESKIPVTVAHELGHGRWKLYHPFDKNYGGFDEAKQTNNLLAYGNGEHIAKWQWDIMNDMAWLVSVFEGDERSAMGGENYSSVIDYDKLIKWLIDNKGKTVQYDFANFVSKEVYEKITGKEATVTKIPIDKIFYGNINGVSTPFNLKGSLSTSKGSVNLEVSSGKIVTGINILPKEDKIEFTLQYGFADRDEVAIGLETNHSKEMEYLFVQQGITYSPWYKAKVTERFKTEIASADKDCDKLDYLYEHIPTFVVSELSDNDKWVNLQSLSNCRIDRIETNEYLAILNILKSISPAYLKTKADNAPDFLMNLYDRFGSAEKIQFIVAVTKSFDNVWTGDEELKVVFPDETLIIDLSNTYAVSCFGNEHGLTFAYSYFQKSESGEYKNPEDQLHENCVLPFNKTGSEPVILRVGDEEIVVPAFIAAQIMINSKSESASNLLSLYTSVLLPNVLIRPVIMTKWSKFFKNGTKVVDEVTAGTLFKVDDALKPADELAGVLINGEYKLNPTAKNVNELVKNPSGAMKLDQSAESILNGQYMYVIDDVDNIIIGTRAKGFDFSIPDGKAPHPTLIGGVNPLVKVAGIIEFRAGKIYKVNNVSGHFKPSNQSLEVAKQIFNQNFLPSNFANDFQGFIPFSN